MILQRWLKTLELFVLGGGGEKGKIMKQKKRPKIDYVGYVWERNQKKTQNQLMWKKANLWNTEEHLLLG